MLNANMLEVQLISGDTSDHDVDVVLIDTKLTLQTSSLNVTICDFSKIVDESALISLGSVQRSSNDLRDSILQNGESGLIDLLHLGGDLIQLLNKASNSLLIGFKLLSELLLVVSFDSGVLLMSFRAFNLLLELGQVLLELFSDQSGGGVNISDGVRDSLGVVGGTTRELIHILNSEERSKFVDSNTLIVELDLSSSEKELQSIQNELRRVGSIVFGTQELLKVLRVVQNDILVDSGFANYCFSSFQILIKLSLHIEVSLLLGRDLGGLSFLLSILSGSSGAVGIFVAGRIGGGGILR
mmetsp:Transcript_110230/g.154666  ORF Transcript_110230/g.154666 Transcript_110230/m.154666 type:complete len:298 (+) Transcript_110230:344-1237(+)